MVLNSSKLKGAVCRSGFIDLEKLKALAISSAVQDDKGKILPVGMRPVLNGF